MALDRAKLKARLAGMSEADRAAIREEVQRDLERYRETLEWYEHRTTWAPKLTEEEKRQRELDIEKFKLPF